MSNFKRFFYLTYLVFFLVAAFIAVYYEDLVLRWEWDFISGWISLLKFVLKLGGIGVVLFIIELIIENIHIATLKGKISTLEKEKLELKAKLYDQAEAEAAPEVLDEAGPDAAENEEKEPETN